VPVYAYLCEDCDHPFDVRATFAEKEAGLKPTCPSCRGRRVKQVITAGLLIKGPSVPGGSPCGCSPAARSGCCPQ
jgi:putative FmdB family regulatory protein